ncbi:MAG: hypothetical protein ABGW78_16810 [Pirellulales bacterium]
MSSLIIQFTGLAFGVAIAGTFLARSADRIAELTGLGRLIIGSLLLAAVTSLPELTVDIAAVRAGLTDIAVGDLFGSSLMNLFILACLDLAWRGERRMFSREAASHALAATLGIVLTGLAGAAVLTAHHIHNTTLFFGVSIWSWAILAAYLLGIRMLYLNQRIALRAHKESILQGDDGTDSDHDNDTSTHPAISIFTFFVAAIVILFAGPRLSHVAGELSEKSGLSGTFVGTTLVAITTSLPELVSSLTALRMGAIDLAIGNAFGSNAFNMVLLFPLDVVHKDSIFASLSSAHTMTALAVMVTSAIAVLGQLYQKKTRIPFFEPDAILMIFIIAGSMFIIFQLS